MYNWRIGETEIGEMGIGEIVDSPVNYGWIRLNVREVAVKQMKRIKRIDELYAASYIDLAIETKLLCNYWTHFLIVANHFAADSLLGDSTHCLHQLLPRRTRLLCAVSIPGPAVPKKFGCTVLIALLYFILFETVFC